MKNALIPTNNSTLEERRQGLKWIPEGQLLTTQINQQSSDKTVLYNLVFKLNGG